MLSLARRSESRTPNPIDLAAFWGCRGKHFMIKKYYSPSQIIKKSDTELDVEDLRDLCLRGILTPCIYFDGNLVCISAERYQQSKNGPVAHTHKVIWTLRFKGYISFIKLADYLDPTYHNDSNVFFEVDKIVEHISEPENYAQRIPIPSHQILKAFPPKIDDDINEVRWLIESLNFEGNPFDPQTIKFPKEEVDALLELTNKIYEPTPKSNLIRSIENFDKQIGLKPRDDYIFSHPKDTENNLNRHSDTSMNESEDARQKIESPKTDLYSTPALQALQGVIENFWLKFDPAIDIPPKQIAVVEWIKTNYPDVQASNICTYIDKICRHPKARVGGNKKNKL